VGCLCMALALSATVPAHAQDQAGDQSGNWQPHKLTFNYVGISPTYSCEGLREDMEFLLRQSGARVDSITAFSCENGGGVPSKLVSARLIFSTLQPAADEAAQGQSEQGTWRHIEFSNTRSAPQLRGADCELVQEFQTQVLPAFTTRNVQARLPCVPHQTIGYQWALSFDAFVPNSAGGRTIGGAD
jgi:hypothetical protein